MRTTEEIKEIVESLGYEFIYEYVGNSYRRVIIKDLQEYKYDVCLNELIRGKKPNFVSISNPFVLENMSRWLEINSKSFRLKENNVYLGNREKLFFSCHICSKEFDSIWDCIYGQGHGCSYCSGQRVSDKNRLPLLYPELASEWHPTKNGNLTPNDVSYASGKKVWWICKEGHEWNAKINSRTSGNGCPHCFIKSHGENSVRSFLHKYSIRYIPEYRFEDCRYKNTLPFDFSIFDSNGYLHCLVEYHGRQHYEPVDFFGGEKAFRELQIRDKIKEEYCEDNNIPLKIIPYWEFNNIEQILIETLQLT